MKRSLAAVLIASLVASPASAGQKPVEWEKVKKLSPGTEIVLTVAGGQPTKVHVMFADDARLLTLKEQGPKLSRRVEQFLFRAGPHWHDIVDRGGTYRGGTLRLSQAGLFDVDRKLADLTDLVQQTPRAEVAEVLVERSWWSRNWWWVVPVAVVSYVLLGLLLAQPTT